MADDILRIKTDVLNQLRNDKYYIQDELRLVVDSTIPQKEKVEKIIKILKELNDVDRVMNVAEAVFQIQPVPQYPTQSETPETNEDDISDPDTPTNIVEPQLNDKGHTHSE